MKQLLMIPLLLTTLPAQADFYQPGGTQQTACYENVYREEYVPGTKDNPGRVRRYNERIQVDCDEQQGYVEPRRTSTPRPRQTDDNSCLEGTVIGGLLGGGIGGAISRGDGRWAAVPAGAVIGGLLGCQVDGG